MPWIESLNHNKCNKMSFTCWKFDKLDNVEKLLDKLEWVELRLIVEMLKLSFLSLRVLETWKNWKTKTFYLEKLLKLSIKSSGHLTQKMLHEEQYPSDCHSLQTIVIPCSKCFGLVLYHSAHRIYKR